MKHISLIVPEGKNNLATIIGAYKILGRVNAHWKEKSKKEYYKIELVGISKKVDFYDGLFSIKPPC